VREDLLRKERALSNIINDDITVSTLVHAALEAAKQAYSPYSSFMVGAAVLTGSGIIYSGCNMENAAYEGGPHAETSALVAMNAAGERDVRMIVCVGYSVGQDPIIGLAPCGGCRQKLYELSSLNDSTIEVVIADPSTGELMIKTIQELLPHAFGPRDIGIDTKRFQG